MKRTDKEAKQMMLAMHSIYNNPDNHFASLRSGFHEPINLFEAELHKIIDAETKTSLPLRGIKKEKEKKYELLGLALFHIASGASAYASSPLVLNYNLKAKVDYPISTILYLPYNKMDAFSQGIIDTISPIISLLQPYGVVAADLTDAINKREAFLAVAKNPQIAKGERKIQNANIHPFIVEAKRILTEMCDPIAGTLLKDHPDLFQLWFNTRKIDSFPSGTTIVHGFVYKSNGITPVYNATITFSEQGLTTKTYLDGSYRIPKFPHGITTAIASYESVSQKSKPFEVKLGKTVKQNFLLDI